MTKHTKTAFMPHTTPFTAALMAGIVALTFSGSFSGAAQAASGTNIAEGIADESEPVAEKVRTRKRPTPGSLTDSIKARGFWFGSDAKPAPEREAIRVETHNWGQAELPPTSSASSTDEQQWALVDGAVVNIRSGPSLSADRVGSFTQGTRLRVMERGDGWTRVEDPKSGQSGWMHQDFLTVAKGPGKTS